MILCVIRPARRHAFTLIELLLVIVIIGVLTAIVAPQFSAGLGGTRLQVEARAVAQSERYARTMALLHQAEVDLVIDTNGTLRVDAAAQSGEDRGVTTAEDGIEASARAASAGSTATAPRMAVSSRNTFGSVLADELAAGDAPAVTQSAAVVTSEAFAGAIHVEHVFDRVTVRFLGYTDSETGAPDLDSAAATPAEGDAPVMIRFHSNGTCRPHRFRLEDASGAALEVQIDVLGAAKIDDVRL